MKHLKAVVLLAVIAALLVVVLAPSAMAASAGVTMKLTGPSQANDGAKILLQCTIKNPQKADGNRVALVLQNKNGDLKRLGSKAITWYNGGTKGVVDFWVTAHASAMGIAKYRAAWMHPLGTTHSNVKSVSIN